jgi:phosphohistidine phosphatase
LEIILVRHAQASHDPKIMADADRPLTKDGIKEEKKAAKKMYELGIKFNRIWVSPLLRAQQTLDIIQKIYKSKISPEIKPELEGDKDPDPIVQTIESESQIHPNDVILIVSHNMLASDLLHLFIEGNAVEMGTSEVAWLHKSEDGFKLTQYLAHSDF